MRNPFKRIRVFFRKPAMIGTPPSAQPMWHDPAAHARDFAERYAWELGSIIAHEYEEWRHGGSHVAALKHAPVTELAITDRARQIGRAMQKGWRGR
jgi:hypothetical protein